MASTNPPSLVLQEDTIKRVQARDRSLIGDEQNGTRLISRSLLESSPESSISTVSIPVNMYSPQTYECIGLTPTMAKLIYDDGENIRHDILEKYGEGADFGEFSFEEYMINRVIQICEEVLAAGDGENWFEAMTAAGIKQELQDSIMDEDFADIRGMQCLEVWLDEIFSAYFRTFKNLDKRISAWEKDVFSEIPLKGGAAGKNKETATPSS
ncbi:hypothetical protein yc1106_00253 [Curvularia clavata]|uniref:Uncharacterized protein n=1 Tax=Curvularia clavata TaxID=95742 RepID=A0A9Q8Z1B5_CURCL|nr:hypothetical protein yc1106_00253 [Curvularia clavata]